MSRRHNAVWDYVFRGLNTAPRTAGNQNAMRFLKRPNALAESGMCEERVRRWVDPAQCTMWERHNRDYSLLNESNCADLINSIKAQGKQEFPAIVRRRGEGYEVICGARRHFAISWLKANSDPEFRYLIELRELSDEEAFRLADIENRDREDISDYERARDYAQALEAYYNGQQKSMAARLDVSEGWLSRYLQLAKLPIQIVAAYPNQHEVKELHVRTLKPYLGEEAARIRILAEADQITREQKLARDTGREPVSAAQVCARLKAAGADQGAKRPEQKAVIFRRNPAESGIAMLRRGGKVRLEFSESLSDDAVRAAFEMFLGSRQ